MKFSVFVIFLVTWCCAESYNIVSPKNDETGILKYSPKQPNCVEIRLFSLIA